MDNENLAYRYYDSMVLNYAKWQKGGVDKKACRGRFMNAALSLAKLGLPNPFTFTQTEDNAQAWPVKPGIVTAVAE